MITNAFSFAPSPVLHFGVGKISLLPSTIKPYGNRILLVTGGHSFAASPYQKSVLDGLHANGITVEQFSVSKEPSPAIIDEAVDRYSAYDPEIIVGIGGGSVLDAAKAISAMLPMNEPVKNYLEGVGTKAIHPGIKVPFIAVPTTSGTGSEAARNAVLSEIGAQGFKRSLRHTNFVADIAILDPLLTVSCPPSTTAASGMDAFTQLLESYLSTAGNNVTDALAYEGLKLVADSLLPAYRNGEDIKGRTGMALASYLSGVTLTNAGLGLVHGYAASIGGYAEIPHGVICSSLMPASNIATVRKLRASGDPQSFLLKYSKVGKLFGGAEKHSDEYHTDFILDLMSRWRAEMQIPSIAQHGITSKDFNHIAALTENKNNPVALDQEEMIEVLAWSVAI